jgi:hypothetical protein
LLDSPNALVHSVMGPETILQHPAASGAGHGSVVVVVVVVVVV